MKQLLYALLLSPFCTNAQLLEVNMNLGANIHTFTERGFRFNQHEKKTVTPGYAGSVSATVKLPYNFRAGLSISTYRLGYRWEYTGLHPGPAQRISIRPVLFEIIGLSRNCYKTFDLDLGIIGGVCMNRSVKIADVEGLYPVMTNPYKTTWISYGLLGSCLFHISNSFALGGEIQPKFISGNIPGDRKTIFVLPVSVKGTIRI